VRYAFVIDQNRCIGCHACTLACKEEHNVPVGVFRTWVKYIEKGEFPDTSRHFGVMRCNHCDDAPCVDICPTHALFRRPDGIVDFDSRRCIGCKSCMQACPYDALYIDPNSHTAAKCNFCAHRIEKNLEPACVVVCPTRAIIAGDMDDEHSEIARIIATQKVASRKPQKGTNPKLFYVGIEGDFLQPSTIVPDAAYLWSERTSVSDSIGSRKEIQARAKPGAAHAVYDIARSAPWGAIPAFYLWSKSIAGGILLVAAILFGINREGVLANPTLINIVSPILALFFLGVTVALLIADLHRPERFYYILIRPNPRSWLVWGTYILIAYSVMSTLWLAFGIAQSRIPDVIVWIAALTGIGSACYSAYLFAQAKGRDLWQSPLFLWHLLIQALLAGAALLLILFLISGGIASALLIPNLRDILIAAVAVSAIMVLGEISLTPMSADVRHAIAVMTRGDLRVMFWGGALIIGAVVPLVLLGLAPMGGVFTFGIAAAVAALIGLLLFELVWIKAGQAAPLS
jgi:Fe-S-cluster-containing dehydrogenase component/formate-dependent nitrite reductase membrane component NrfD